MIRMTALILALCMLLCGCSWFSGSYYSETPYQGHLTDIQSGEVSAANYLQLQKILMELVQTGTESAIIYTDEYDQSLVQSGVRAAVRYVKEMYPIGAYAVEDISYEIGARTSRPAVLVDISYLHGRYEIGRIETVQNVAAAQDLIADALENCDVSLVMEIKEYYRTDFTQIVEDYAELAPNLVMEIPEVTVAVYPDYGVNRVVELKFSYETSRDSLRQMQSQVQRVFASSRLYVNSEDIDALKYAQLYAFLMERFDYQMATSITPAYSLLSHGVGDSRAFAVVYAAMCRQVNLECHVITGTRNGEPWSWNLVRDDGVYYHVDLLACSQNGAFCERRPDEMEQYVWDYSAYPDSNAFSEK